MPIISERVIEVARTMEDVERLRPFWTRQLTNRDGALDFYLLQLRLRPEVVRPHVIVLGGATARRMLIGRLEQKPFPIRIRYRAHPSRVLRILTFIDGGVTRTLSANDSAAIVREVIASLRDGDADVAVFENIAVDHPISSLARFLPGRFCADWAPVRRSHHARNLRPGGPLLPTLSRQERYNHRRRARRLREQFRDVQIGCFHDLHDFERLLADAESIARRTYQRGMGVGFVSDAPTRQTLAFQAANKSLRGHILYLDRQPTAFWIGGLHNGVFYSDYLGFDPSYAAYSPGIHLMIEVMEELSRDPASWPRPVVDFGIGDADYKSRLGNVSRHAATTAIFAPTAKALAANGLHTIAALSATAGRSLLRNSGLEAHLRRSLRRRAAPL
jgi:hypothetical protein